MAAVEGVEVKYTNLDKVLYPATGTTRADVINYYLAVATSLLPGLAGRTLTRRRWPRGVEAPPFFAKDLDSGTPAWMPRIQIAHRDGPKFWGLRLVDSRNQLIYVPGPVGSAATGCGRRRRSGSRCRRVRGRGGGVGVVEAEHGGDDWRRRL